jgi:acyl-CoA reductase-like NAD-dependent aldehyde dehydrogenase
LGEGRDAVGAAVAAGIDKVVLTGSAATGRSVLAALADRLVPASVELSGCDAAFVGEDADLPLASRALAFGLRWNGGATCIAPRRAFVVSTRAVELERLVGAEVRRLPHARCPAETARRAAELVQDALARGARLVAGRIPGDEDGFAPCVLAEARPDMALLREELFAPVLALAPVPDDEAALRAAAACPYALGAVVFGGPRRAVEFAGRIRAGVVLVNDVIVPTADPRLPFGGRGASGFGTTRGAEGLLEMTLPKAVVVRRGGHRHLDLPAAGDADLFQDYIKAAHGTGWRARGGALVRLGGALLRRFREKGTHERTHE